MVLKWSLPDEETSLVLIRLPAKLVACLRGVCKNWLFLISSPKFVSSHLEHERKRSQSDHQKLLLFHDLYRNPRTPPDPVESALICYSLDTLIVGSINGLICSVGHSRFHPWPSPDDIWIWNPSTGLSKKLPFGKHTFTRTSNAQVTFAFCWDDTADDYKLVKIVSKKCESTFAEVWASSSDCWKEINVDRCFYHPTHPQLAAPATHCDVFVETSPYWVVIDYEENMFAASFDIETDELKLFPFPLLSSPKESVLMSIISKNWQFIVTSWKGNFAVLDLHTYIKDDCNNLIYKYDLWTMDRGGVWSKRFPVFIDFHFWYCSNTIGGKLLLQGASGIKLYDFETKDAQTLYGYGDCINSICVGFNL